MNDLRQSLKSEFEDIEFRYAYAESFLNTKLATQIKVLREQRGKKQQELAAEMGTKQSGFSRFEDVNHSVWKTDTLWKIARVLGVRVAISFETFSSIVDDKQRFDREHLERPAFDDDPGWVGCELHSEPSEDPVIPRLPSALGKFEEMQGGNLLNAIVANAGGMATNRDIGAFRKGPMSEIRSGRLAPVNNGSAAGALVSQPRGSMGGIQHG